MERLLHLARRRAARLAVAALLGLPATLSAQSPTQAEQYLSLSAPRPMPSPAHPWTPPAVAVAPNGPIAPGGPAAALGAPVAPEAEPSGQPPAVWRGVMDGVDSAPARPGTLPSPSSGAGSVMWVVKSNGAVVPAPASGPAPAAPVTPAGAVNTAPAAERAAATTTNTALPGKHLKPAPLAAEVVPGPAATLGAPPMRWYGYGTYSVAPIGYAPAGGNVVPGAAPGGKMPKTSSQHWQPAQPGTPTTSATIPNWPSNADVIASLRPPTHESHGLSGPVLAQAPAVTLAPAAPTVTMPVPPPARPTPPVQPAQPVLPMPPVPQVKRQETMVIGPPPPPVPASRTTIPNEPVQAPVSPKPMPTEAPRNPVHLPEGRPTARPLSPVSPFGQTTTIPAPVSPAPISPVPVSTPTPTLPRFSQPTLPPVPPPLPATPTPTTPVVPPAAMNVQPVTPALPSRPGASVTPASATVPAAPQTPVARPRTLQEIVEQANAGLGRDLQVLRRTDGNLVIRFKARQATDAEALVNRLSSLPELARFKVDFEAQLTP